MNSANLEEMKLRGYVKLSEKEGCSQLSVRNQMKNKDHLSINLLPVSSFIHKTIDALYINMFHKSNLHSNISNSSNCIKFTTSFS